MPSGLIALLDDVAVIARAAAASFDDVAAAASKAGAKAAGVVIDDAAVTPRYVGGLTPDRELPIIFKITLGSLRNKLLFLLPGALLLSAFLPWAITPLLMIGGAYLAFEATEKIIEIATGDHHGEAGLAECDSAADLEARQVQGAVRTDLILSAEIMAIALASLDGLDMMTQAAALALVAVAITLGVYGFVALIVKLDDIGLHLARRRFALTRAIGRGLVLGVPKLLGLLSGVGTAAMLWVGGGILLHGIEELELHHLPETVHEVADGLAAQMGNAAPLVSWIANATAAAIVGGAVGLALVIVVRQFTSHPERLVVDN